MNGDTDINHNAMRNVFRGTTYVQSIKELVPHEIILKTVCTFTKYVLNN